MADHEEIKEEKIVTSLEGSRDGQIGRVILSSVELLRVLIKSHADPQRLETAVASFNKERRQGAEIDRETPSDDLISELSTSLEMAMTTLIERERSKQSAALMQLASASTNGEKLEGLGSSDESQKSELKEEYSDGETSMIDTTSRGDSIPQQAQGKNFECNICGKRYTRRETLNRHQRCHLEDEKDRKPYHCDECGKRFSEAGSLKSHKRIHLDLDDPRKMKFVCDICGKCSTSKQYIKIHKRSHLEDDKERQPFACGDCGRRFAEAFSLKRHRRIHFGADNRFKLECDICGKLLSSVKSLNYHKRTHLSDADPENAVLKRPYKCDQCGKRFADCTQYKNHRKLHHSKNDNERRPFECKECGRRFAQRGRRDEHMITHMVADDRRKFECDICGKLISSSQALNNHKLTHLSDIDPENEMMKRPYICDQCGKRFTSIVSRKNHMRIHAEDEEEQKPYKCDECGQRFRRVEFFNLHMISHFADDDPRKQNFKCEECGKFLSSSGNLKAHKKRHLKDEKERLPFECDECGKRSSSAGNLKKHKRIHMDIKEECDECGKRFSDYQTFTECANLNKWTSVIHNNDDPRKKGLECDICGKFLCSSRYLQIHKQTHLKNSRPTSNYSNADIRSSESTNENGAEKIIGAKLPRQSTEEERGAWSDDGESEDQEHDGNI